MGVRVLLLVDVPIILIVDELLDVLIVLEDARALLNYPLHCPVHCMSSVVDFLQFLVHALFILFDPIL